MRAQEINIFLAHLELCLQSAPFRIAAWLDLLTSTTSWAYSEARAEGSGFPSSACGGAPSSWKSVWEISPICRQNSISIIRLQFEQDSVGLFGGEISGKGNYVRSGWQWWYVVRVELWCIWLIIQRDLCMSDCLSANVFTLQHIFVCVCVVYGCPAGEMGGGGRRGCHITFYHKFVIKHSTITSFS